jgi:hypothetical protein
MEGIIAIIIIVLSLITSANKAKQVKQNAPGQSAAQPTAQQRPVYPQSVPTRPVQTQTVLRPAQSMTSQTGSFASQVAPKRPEPQKPAVPAGHQAVGNMGEGISRECGHGSVGGSMAYNGHTEGGERAKPVKPDASTFEPMQRPVMSAEEMRRAVIMAEILKRPQERMIEQSRRWNAR